jgi:hypothetical protein
LPVDYIQFGQLGDDLLNIRNGPFPTNDGEEIDYEEWAAESFSIAKNKVYPLFEEGDLNPEYRNLVMEVTGDQIILSGLRLANVIKMLFGD